MDNPAHVPDSGAVITSLLQPDRLWSAAEIVNGFAHVPKAAGVYAWYFDVVPPDVPTNGCHISPDGQVLLYVGIAPREAKTTTKPSMRTLRHRLRDHLGGNAEGSTLRLTLGCLLAEQLGIQLRRVGSGKRYTFTNPGEIVLDRWLAAHAHIAFAAVERPWEIESRLLSQLSLPLNLSGNVAHLFATQLSRLRRAAKLKAAMLPVIVDSGGPRRVVE